MPLFNERSRVCVTHISGQPFSKWKQHYTYTSQSLLSWLFRKDGWKIFHKFSSYFVTTNKSVFYDLQFLSVSWSSPTKGLVKGIHTVYNLTVMQPRLNYYSIFHTSTNVFFFLFFSLQRAKTQNLFTIRESVQRCPKTHPWPIRSLVLFLGNQKGREGANWHCKNST